MWAALRREGFPGIMMLAILMIDWAIIVARALLPLLLGHRGFLFQHQRSPGVAPLHWSDPYCFSTSARPGRSPPMRTPMRQRCNRRGSNQPPWAQMATVGTSDGCPFRLRRTR